MSQSEDDELSNFGHEHEMESLSDVMWKMFGGYLEVLEKF
jgi:hypothetical protein